MKKLLGILLISVLTFSSVTQVIAAEPDAVTASENETVKEQVPDAEDLQEAEEGAEAKEGADAAEDAADDVIADEAVSENDAEAVSEDAVLESEGGFKVNVSGTETSYGASSFISTIDSVTKAAGKTTKIKVTLCEDINTSSEAVVFWGGDVTLDLNGYKVTSGSGGSRLDSVPNWTSYFNDEYGDKTSSVIVLNGASLDVKGGKITTAPYGTTYCYSNGICVGTGSSLVVESDVIIESGICGITSYGNSVVFDGQMNVHTGDGSAYGIILETGDLKIRGGKIDCYSRKSHSPSFGVNLSGTGSFEMIGGEITIDTDDYCLGVYKYDQEGSFKMSGPAGSTKKDDIKIILNAQEEITGGWPTAAGVMLDDYSGTNACIKNTLIEATSDNSPVLEGISISHLNHSGVEIENCKVKLLSTSDPKNQYDSGEMYGIRCYIQDFDEAAKVTSKIKNTDVYCETNASAIGIDGYNIENSTVNVTSHGDYFMPRSMGIFCGRRIPSTISGTHVVVGMSEPNAGSSYQAYAMYATYGEGAKVDVGKNTVLETTYNRGYALSGPDNTVFPVGGKWYDKSGKVVQYINSAKYLKTAAGATPAPADTKVALSKAKFTWDEEILGTAKAPFVYYDGTEKKPGFTLTDAAGTALSEGTDYSVSYVPKTGSLSKAGSVTVNITALEGGNCTGTLKKTYTIKPAKFADILDDPNKADDDSNPLKVYIEDGGYAAYLPTGAKPAVTLTFNGNELTPGTDYVLGKYLNNKAVGDPSAAKPPMLQITGKGNFTGLAKIAFTIDPRVLDAEEEAFNISEVLYSTKPGKWMPKISIKDGKAKLKAGKDYTIDGYSTSEDMSAPVEASSSPEAGTVIFVKISGKKNYDGYVVLPYTIRSAMLNKSVASIREGVTLPDEASEITEDMLLVLKDAKSKIEIAPDEYQIVSAEYVTGKKSARYLVVKLQGVTGGMYGGTKSCKIAL